MNKSQKEGAPAKVVICCGDSAGHVYPGIALAEALRDKRMAAADITFLISRCGLPRDILKKEGFTFYILPIPCAAELSGRASNLLREFTRIVPVRMAWGVIRSYMDSLKILSRVRPDVLAGFGSSVALGPFLAAKTLGIPVVIHEQNVVMGKANAIMGLFADKVAFSFPGLGPGRKNKWILTGNPIRKNFCQRVPKREARKRLRLDEGGITILVMGGSQGARTINKAFIEMLSVHRSSFEGRAQFIHITGYKDFEEVVSFYQKGAYSAKVFAYAEDMAALYNASDIAVSRAGSSSICELASAGVASILIPYPYAGNHQLLNAEFLNRKEACFVIPENELTRERFYDNLMELLEAETLRKRIVSNMKVPYGIGAGARLAEVVAETAKTAGER